MTTYDCVVRNGEVIDGSGKPRFRADLGIKDERIAAIAAPGSLTGAQTVDAAGRIVAPGFIDVHTHDDTALIDNPSMAMKASQGVTTVICGNCGASPAPYQRPDMPPLLSLIVKNPANVAPSFAAFAAKVEAARPALNGAFLIGHSTLRMSVMGTDLNRQATQPEIAAMRDLLDESLEQGAIGLSSGLFYPPAMAASTDEVAEVAAPLGKHQGIYTAHMRDERDDILQAMDETFEIGRRAGAASIVVSHHKCAGRQNFGRMRETLPKMEAAMRQLPVGFDVYPYVAGSTILRKEMLDDALKVIITFSETVPGMSGRDLADIAREWGIGIHEAADRLQPAGAIYFMMDEGDVQRALSHPDAMIGSDGIPFDAHPHPRLWGTFPRVLGHYSRDLGLFPLEDAVRRMSALPARNFRLKDRGEIKEGYFADLCVFDPATVIDSASFEVPMTPARGIDMVFVNGAPVWREGRSTGERPGRVLRRQS